MSELDRGSMINILTEVFNELRTISGQLDAGSGWFSFARGDEEEFIVLLKYVVEDENLNSGIASLDKITPTKLTDFYSKVKELVSLLSDRLPEDITMNALNRMNGTLVANVGVTIGQTTQQVTQSHDFVVSVPYIPVEGIGMITNSVISTTVTLSDNSLKVFSLGWYVGKALVDDYKIVGTATLFIDGKNITTQPLEYPSYNSISKGPPYRIIGVTNFEVDSASESIEVHLDYTMVLLTNYKSTTTPVKYPTKEILIK